MEKSGERAEPESTSRPTYRLTLEGEGITVAREVEQEVARQILGVVMGGGRDVGPRDVVLQTDIPRPPSSPGRAGRRGPSLREYLDDVNAKRNVEKILAIASYLTGGSSDVTFGSDDVKKTFRQAGERAPGNYSRDFRWAKSTGWIAEDQPGEYYVTETGLQAIAGKFSDDVRKATGVDKSIRRRRSRRKAGEA